MQLWRHDGFYNQTRVRFSFKKRKKNTPDLVGATFHLQRQRLTTFSRRSLPEACIVIVTCVSNMQPASVKMQNAVCASASRLHTWII